jgi:hypothetical protein
MVESRHRLRVERRPNLVQAIEDNLPVPPGRGKPLLFENSQVVRDEVLRLAADPGEVADAELAASGECIHELEARWIGEHAHSARHDVSQVAVELANPEFLRANEIETEDLATFIHGVILTAVDSCHSQTLCLS